MMIDKNKRLERDYLRAQHPSDAVPSLQRVRVAGEGSRGPAVSSAVRAKGTSENILCVIWGEGGLHVTEVYVQSLSCPYSDLVTQLSPQSTRIWLLVPVLFCGCPVP